MSSHEILSSHSGELSIMTLKPSTILELVRNHPFEGTATLFAIQFTNVVSIEVRQHIRLQAHPADICGIVAIRLARFQGTAAVRWVAVKHMPTKPEYRVDYIHLATLENRMISCLDALSKDGALRLVDAFDAAKDDAEENMINIAEQILLQEDWFAHQHRVDDTFVAVRFHIHKNQEEYIHHIIWQGRHLPLEPVVSYLSLNQRAREASYIDVVLMWITPVLRNGHYAQIALGQVHLHDRNPRHLLYRLKHNPKSHCYWNSVLAGLNRNSWQRPILFVPNETKLPFTTLAMTDMVRCERHLDTRHVMRIPKVQKTVFRIQKQPKWMAKFTDPDKRIWHEVFVRHFRNKASWLPVTLEEYVKGRVVRLGHVQYWLRFEGFLDDNLKPIVHIEWTSSFWHLKKDDRGDEAHLLVGDAIRRKQCELAAICSIHRTQGVIQSYPISPLMRRATTYASFRRALICLVRHKGQTPFSGVHTRIILGQEEEEEENPLEESKSQHSRIAQGPVAAQANENPQGLQGRSGLWDAQGKEGPQGFMGAMGAQGNEGPQDFMQPYTYPQFIMQSITDVQRLMGVQNNEGPQGFVNVQTPQLTIRGSTGARGFQGLQGPTTKPREIVEHGG